MEKQPLDKDRRNKMMIIGTVLLVIGMAMILVWWRDILIVIRGVLALGLALAGLFVLYRSTD